MTLVAVYGSLREGFGNHRLLEGAEFVATGVTIQNFTMHSLGGFPAIVEDGDTNITVEVYRVDDTTFRRLDILEGYPTFYNRKKTAIAGYDGEEYTTWIYFMEQDNMYIPKDVVESGDWREYKLSA